MMLENMYDSASQMFDEVHPCKCILYKVEGACQHLGNMNPTCPSCEHVESGEMKDAENAS